MKKNLLKLYNLDAEYIESITERITNLTEALKGRKKMVNLFKAKDESFERSTGYKLWTC